MGKVVSGTPTQAIPLVSLFAWMKRRARCGATFAGAGPRVLYEFVKRIGQARSLMPVADPLPFASAGISHASEPPRQEIEKP